MNNKRFKLSIFAILTAALFMLASCENLAEQPQSNDGKAYLKFSTEMVVARSTFYPTDLAIADITKAEISYITNGASGTPATLGTWTTAGTNYAVNLLTAASIEVPLGTYDFTLNLYVGTELAETGSVTNKAIVSGSNTIEFTSMSYVPAGKGDLSVKLNWTTADKVLLCKSGLFNESNNGATAVTGYELETLAISTEDKACSATYSKTGVPSGSYLLKTFLYSSAEESDENLVKFSLDTVKISASCTTTGMYTVDKINKFYTLSFDANGGTGNAMDSITCKNFKTYTIPACTFTPVEEVKPFMAWNTKTDGSGTWYENEATDVTLTEDTTLYAQYSVTVDHLAACLECLTKEKTTDITLLDATDSNQETIGAAFLADTTTASKVALTLLESTSLTKIIDNAYEDCTTLASIAIPENVTSIGSNAFSGCSALTSIAIPDKVTEIKERTFYYCTGLTSVTLPSTLEKIGNAAFYNCVKLPAITIPATVTSIGYQSFSGCNALTIKIPEANTSYNILYNGKGIITEDGKTLVECIDYTSETVAIPTTVETIGIFAFADCKNLTTITIPDSVKTISIYAFVECENLTTITIPNSVEEIGAMAFARCDIPAAEIVIPASVMRLGCSVFEKNSEYNPSIRFEDTSSWYYKVLNPETDTIDSLIYRGGTTQDFSTANKNGKYMASSYGNAYFYYYYYKAPCITSFSLTAAKNSDVITKDCVGVVDEAANTIKVTVPADTTLTALVPTFTIKSADSDTATATVGTTEQASGTTLNDFTSGVTYTVTASDGKSTQAYTVTVEQELVYAVGDILLSDGTKVDVANIDSITADQAGKAVAVVAGKSGSGKNMAVGLKQGKELVWASRGKTGCNTNFTDIVCTPETDNASTATFTGDTDGSDNWSIIKEKDIDGTDTATKIATNYPAFNYAVTYGTTAGLTGDYASGWYIPSLAELWTVNNNKTTINASITAINTVLSGSATAIGSSYNYWSSSQIDFSSNTTEAWGVYFYGGKVCSNKKSTAYCVLVVRAF